MERWGSRWSRRQVMLGAAGLGLVTGCGRLPWQGEAQPSPKAVRIGYLVKTPSSQDDDFRQALRDAGYAEGQNVAIEPRYWEGRADHLPDLATELVRLPVDVIVTWGTPETLAAKNATSTIPIVFLTAGDPVVSGLVASLGRPGGNVTGLANVGVQLTGKRMQLLTEVVPGLSRIAFLLAVDNPIAASVVREAQPAAQALGLQVQFLSLRVLDDVASGFEAAISQGAEAAFAPQSVEWFYREIVDGAAQRRLPVMYAERRAVQEGGLMGYGANLVSMHRRAAYYVDRILKGAKPAELPVEQPREFEFVVNLKTAAALGITFPNEIMLQVTEVIQ